MKWKMLPLPGELSSQMRPPISPTSWAAVLHGVDLLQGYSASSVNRTLPGTFHLQQGGSDVVANFLMVGIDDTAIPAATAFNIKPEVSLYDHSRAVAAKLRSPR